MRSADRIHRRTAFIALACATAGNALLIVGILTAVLLHPGDATGPFHVRNHFVSELGWSSRAPLAWLFNAAIAVGSLLFIPVVYALHAYFRTRLGLIATVFGIGALLFASAVGLFPMDAISSHLVVSTLFFVGWMIAVALFTVAFFREATGKERPTMVATGIAALGSCLLLLFSPKDSLVAAIHAVQRNEFFHRPGIWWLAVVEWGVVLCAWMWMLAATAVVWNARKRGI